MSSRATAALLVLALSAALRLPALGLPLEGGAAELASIAEYVGGDRGWLPAGQEPLLPLAASILVASGIDPTLAVRIADFIFGILIAPLVLLLALRLGLGAGLGMWIGLFTAVHPLLAINAGGVHPGSDAAALCVLLSAALLVASASAGVRRMGAVLLAVLMAAHPAGALYAVPLLAVYVLREPGPRLQLVLPALALGALFAGPVAPWRGPGAATPLGDLLLGWLPLAGLAVVWVMVVPGVRHLTAPDAPQRGVMRAWTAGAVLHLLAMPLLPVGRAAGFELDLPSGGALLVPFLLVTGLTGWARAAQGLPKAAFAIRATRRLACAAAAALSVVLVSGALQVALLPGRPAAAGRLTWLREAVAQAAAAAGADGWVVLGVAEDEPATQASLADAHPGRAVCRRAPLPERPDEDGLRVLLPFPAAAYPADQPFAVVVPAPRRDEAPTLDSVTTFGGEGIFAQEPVSRVGAYLVMRVHGASLRDEERKDE